jgi:hypothetical protein
MPDRALKNLGTDYSLPIRRPDFPSLAPAVNFRLKCQVTQFFRQPDYRLCGIFFPQIQQENQHG